MTQWFVDDSKFKTIRLTVVGYPTIRYDTSVFRRCTFVNGNNMLLQTIKLYNKF